MSSMVTGLHHVTGAAVDPQEDYDFYIKTLGLRLVKRTVNHEAPQSWHFFYGDYEGNPGTVMTNFLFKGIRVRNCTRGRGSISEVSYSVPPGSIDFWRKRLSSAGFKTEDRPDRFGEKVLFFEDPAQIPSEMIETSADTRDPRALGEISDAEKIRGFHSVTIVSRIPELTQEFFTKYLRFEVAGEENGRIRFAIDGGGPGKWVDMIDMPDAPWAKFGIGSIHHFALTVPKLADIQRLFLVLGGQGLILTDMRDRTWFQSMYFTEPGGINLEFSNVDPGFTVDEPLEELGEHLLFAKHLEPRRAEIESVLPELAF